MQRLVDREGHRKRRPAACRFAGHPLLPRSATKDSPTRSQRARRGDHFDHPAALLRCRLRWTDSKTAFRHAIPRGGLFGVFAFVGGWLNANSRVTLAGLPSPRSSA